MYTYEWFALFLKVFGKTQTSIYLLKRVILVIFSSGGYTELLLNLKGPEHVPENRCHSSPNISLLLLRSLGIQVMTVQFISLHYSYLPRLTDCLEFLLLFCFINSCFAYAYSFQWKETKISEDMIYACEKAIVKFTILLSIFPHTPQKEFLGLCS